MQRYQKDMSKFLKSETTSDFVFVGSEGRSFDRQAFMKFGESSDGFLKNEFSNVKIRQYGNAAIVTAIWSHSHHVKATDSTDNYTESVTEVFVFKNGKWLYASHHSSPVAAQKE